MKASVVISSKDRCEELRAAIKSCRSQTAAPEIIVIDDGSSDGTSEMVPTEFPEVRFFRNETSKGYIVCRNAGAALACGDVVFSIDDDAEFSTPLVIYQTLADFDDPRVAVVAIPLIEPRYGERRLQFAPDNESVWVCDCFKGTAYAIRRDVFLKVGGFCTDMIHQGEEVDLSIRLLDCGLFVRLGRADPIVHHESPKRDLRRMHFFGRRNDLLFAFRNVPLMHLFNHSIGTTWNGLRAMVGATQRFAMLAGILRGWWDGLSILRGRAPVKSNTYRLYRQMRKWGARPIDQLFPN